jgi:hypothetical protein
MSKNDIFSNFYKIVATAFLLLFTGAACSGLAGVPAATPIIQVVQVNREVTRQVVVEVTRIVEVPVTVTPLPSPVESETPLQSPVPSSAASPTLAATFIPPVGTILIHTECLYGPDPVYLGRYELLENSPQLVIGQSQDSTWLYVQGVDHKDPCWVAANIVKVDATKLDGLPITEPVLSPYSTLYPAPPAVSTNRVGNDVTVFWLPVAMSEADYHGYLIEAWVCQGGKQVFIPKGYLSTFDKNDVMLAVKIKDEPGCSEPSSARIYTVNTHGYSLWKNVPWAAFPSSSLTPTVTP